MDNLGKTVDKSLFLGKNCCFYTKVLVCLPPIYGGIKNIPPIDTLVEFGIIPYPNLYSIPHNPLGDKNRSSPLIFPVDMPEKRTSPPGMLFQLSYNQVFHISTAPTTTTITQSLFNRNLIVLLGLRSYWIAHRAPSPFHLCLRAQLSHCNTIPALFFPTCFKRQNMRMLT